MSMVSSETITQVLRALLTEAYAGPPDPSTTWFVDNEPGAGVLGTLESVTAEEASTAPAPDVATIAAHTEHLRWSLALTNALLRGEQPQENWEESWAVRTVDAPQWDRLRADLRREYETLHQASTAPTDWSDPTALTGAIAVIAHAGFHLGALRQIARVVRARG